jgi:hypothetical protein
MTENEISKIEAGDFRGKLRPLGENFDPQGWICTPWVNFVPKGWSYPLGGGEILCSTLYLLNSRVCSPLGMNEGVNILLGDKVHPRGPTSPLWENHVVKNFPLDLLWNELLKGGFLNEGYTRRKLEPTYAAARHQQN